MKEEKNALRFSYPILYISFLILFILFLFETILLFTSIVERPEICCP